MPRKFLAAVLIAVAAASPAAAEAPRNAAEMQKNAAGAETLFKGRLVVTDTRICNLDGPLTRVGATFDATLNPKLADDEANATIVLSNDELTVAIKSRSPDLGAFFSNTDALFIQADGQTKRMPNLVFMYEGAIKTITERTNVVEMHGLIYFFNTPKCGAVAYRATFVRSP